MTYAEWLAVAVDADLKAAILSGGIATICLCGSIFPRTTMMSILFILGIIASDFHHAVLTAMLYIPAVIMRHFVSEES